jgi:hypothetical protein
VQEVGHDSAAHGGDRQQQGGRHPAVGVGACVEVRFAGGDVQVRNSRDPGGPALSFTADEWTAFLAGAVESEFDLPDG